MPAYRFSWDHFDDRTVLELARDVGLLTFSVRPSLANLDRLQRLTTSSRA